MNLQFKASTFRLTSRFILSNCNPSKNNSIPHIGSFSKSFPLTLSRIVRNMSQGTKASQRIAGKTVLITGASSGIGKATAYELADVSNGNIRLILTARRLDRLEEIKKDFAEKYPKSEVLPVKLDVSKLNEINEFVEALPKEWKDIDVLVNNAGLVFGVEAVGSLNFSEVEIMFNTNVIGLFALTQAILPIFKARGKGDIVNLGSIAGRDPYPNGSIYCATKAALRSFSHSLRKELIDTRIRVIEVDPGAVETEFSVIRFRGDKSKADAVYTGTQPLVAEDIAEIIVFALSRRENTVIAETLVFPSHQASASHVYRKP